MSELLQSAIASVNRAKVSFCRFITANDTGTTGAHQAGFYMPKCAAPLFFDQPGQKGENKDKFVKIKWQDDFETDSRMIYYGRGTRNEYRVTRFGRDFPFLTDENVGNLLVISQQAPEEYEAFVLSSDDDIEDFLAASNLSIEDTNQLLKDTNQPIEDATQTLLDLRTELTPTDVFAQRLADFVEHLSAFPSTQQMAEFARNIYNEAHQIADGAWVDSPDELLTEWLQAEYTVFRAVERKIHADICEKPFPDIDSFIAMANKILNARKSRAGKSLEHHLAAIFTANCLHFEAQAVTEEHKKPDFVFPNGTCYHNFEFPADKLTILGAKTTCKDRWRQVASEADRADIKYLFTIQPGLTSNQLREMESLHIGLVVPRGNIGCFPAEFREKIFSLAWFVGMVKEQQGSIPQQFAALLDQPAWSL